MAFVAFCLGRVWQFTAYVWWMVASADKVGWMRCSHEQSGQEIKGGRRGRSYSLV